MKIGYARKSTHLQDVAHQVDELTKAGCEQIYQDQTSRSGPKRDKKGAPEPRQPGGCKLKTAPVRPVVAARPAEYVCSEDLFY
ncbi:recombinase family protein [Klebsiella pasteurii]|uniref:recombinase family protein n=1 Tax=Klebsiella pasteurii TaxID=2587529 RepID=UPI002ACAB481|nr:recombinase family protein [Klebsiella pasteurii]MDZ5719404.1 recombinase family protein [Klebsiella pasteurii]